MKWEYRMLRAREGMIDDSELADLGATGWELVDMVAITVEEAFPVHPLSRQVPYVVLAFKRAHQGSRVR